MNGKFAYLIMDPDYRPEKDQAQFTTKSGTTFVFTVRNFEEAKERAAQCARDGFGVVELCGAFGENRAREIFEFAGGKMGVGFVVHPPEQDELFNNFFSRR